MTSPHDLVAIPDTERHVPAGARVVGDVDDDETVQVTIYVRSKQTTISPAAVEQVLELPPQMRTYPSAREISELFGADEEDLAKVERWAAEQGLRVDEKSAAKRSLKVSGTARQVGNAFGVALKIYEHAGGQYRGRSGAVNIPRELSGIVEAVFGLDNRRMGRSYFARPRPIPSLDVVRPQPFLAPQVAQIYNFPEPFDGSGQCIGILVFNGQVGNTDIEALGGYDPAALKSYFDRLQLPMPEITNVVVHGPGNRPGDGSIDSDVTDEVLLDIQVAGAIAPRAKFVMYFTEFTERGWVDAIIAAATDDLNKPTVLSISYGNPEDAEGVSLWTSAAIRKVNEAFHQAALRGLTVCCAAGDDGSSDQVRDQLAHTDFPASSPWVLGCGGTRIEVRGAAIRETVWNNGVGSAGGGGVSRLFPLPQYQHFVNAPRSANPGHRIGRVVPDVGGLADPVTGLMIVGPSGNLEGPVGGTSATAPLWAGLIARINQALGRPVGFINTILYKFMASGVLRDVTTGNNGPYGASPGFDACTGLGSPDGVKLLRAFQALGGGSIDASPPITAPPVAPPPVPAPPEGRSSKDSQADLTARLADLENRLCTDALERQAMMTMLSSMANALRRAGIC